MTGFVLRRGVLFFLLANAALVVPIPARAADPSVNLLRLDAARIEWTTLAGGSSAQLRAMTDGDVASVAVAEGTEGTPVDIVYGFAGETTAPEEVRITLPTQDGAGPRAARLEVLVSTVSAHAGFHAVRSDALDPRQARQTFSFPAAAARWVMVRLTPAAGQSRLAVAEIELMGHQGPPQSRYAFAESPARALDVLSRLAGSREVGVSITEDETAAFAAARAGRLDSQAFADVALLASGVLDRGRRASYLRRIDALEAEARKAVAGGRTVSEKGQALLRWLHRGPMSKGYRANQTDLSTLLDTGLFNCVSSATLYSILALRLGLDARAVEVPDHAFAVLYEGTAHMDVETTSAAGFNPSRDRSAVEQFERMTGFRYIPDSNRDQCREINEAGLAAVIYYNHGVELGGQKRYQEALLAYFRAITLDPEFGSAVKNALATLANWTLALAKDEQWEQAIAVATTGLALAPQDPALRTNHQAVWTRWAGALIDRNENDQALAVLKRAAAAIPSGGFGAMQAWVYIKPGEDLVRAQRWEAALSLAEAGLPKLDEVPAAELTKWRQDVYLRWFNAEADQRRHGAAAAVLEQGLLAFPAEPRLRNNAGFLAQEWSKDAARTGGFGQGLAVLRGLARRFPGVEPVGRASVAFVQNGVFAMVEAGQTDQALATLDEARDVLGTSNDAQRIGVGVYDTAAQRRLKAGAFEDAAELYARALGRYPGNPVLLNNVRYLAQEWQKAAYGAGGVPVLAGTVAALRAKFPAMPELSAAATAQVQRAVEADIAAGRFEAALQTAESAQPVLRAPDLASLQERVYDAWAKQQMASKAWEAAAGTYAAALARLGRTSLLDTNIRFLAQQWALDAYARGGADELIVAVRRATGKLGAGPLPVASARMVEAALSTDLRAGRFEAAAMLAERAGDVLGKADADRLTVLVFGSWADTFLNRKDWAGAVTVLDQGLVRVPGASALSQNRAYALGQGRP